MVGEDDILEANVTRAPYGIAFAQPKTNSGADIERIEDRRPMNPEMDVVYLLSPQPYIIDCLMADFDRRRYRKAHLIWTSGQHYLLICPLLFQFVGHLALTVWSQQSCLQSYMPGWTSLL